MTRREERAAGLQAAALACLSSKPASSPPPPRSAPPPRPSQLAFRLLGFIPGAVGLRGTFVSVPDREGGPDRSDTVKVFFEPPVLSLPGDIHIR